MCSACVKSSPSAVNSAAEQSVRSLMFGLRRGAAPPHLIRHTDEARDQQLKIGGVQRRHRSVQSVNVAIAGFADVLPAKSTAIAATIILPFFGGAAVHVHDR